MTRTEPLAPRRLHTGAPRLVLRVAAADLPVTALVAGLTLVVALVCGLVPRALAAQAASDLAYTVGGLGAPVRDLSGATIPMPLGASTDGAHGPAGAAGADPAFGSLTAALAGAKAKAEPALRAVLGAPVVVARDDPQAASAISSIDMKGSYRISLLADRDFEKRITMTDGALPQPWTLPADAVTNSVIGSQLLGDATHGDPIDIVLSKQTADAMNIVVGDELQTSISNLKVDVRVSGLFDPVASGSGYWQHTPSVATVDLFDDGNAAPRYTATGFISPATLAKFAGIGGFNGAFWFPVSADAVTTANAREVAAGIRALQTAQIDIPAAGGAAADSGDALTLRTQVSTGLADAIEQSESRISATFAVVGLLASGPLGVVIAVFALGVRAVLQRRAGTLTLAAARGASGLQLRAVAALEGVAAGLPFAALGAVIAALLLPGADAAAWLAPLLAGLVPAVLFAALGAPGASRATRHDLGARARGGARWIVEACVLGAAAVATLLLLRRGQVADAGLDPLLALTPLLLALAVSVVVLRLLPLALRVTAAAARRARGAVGFIGTARAMRDPALGVAAALAVVVGVSVSVFASGVLATIESGAHTAAVAQLGADVSASGAVFDRAAQRAVEGSRGVIRMAGTMTAGNAELESVSRMDHVVVVLGPSGPLRGIQPSLSAKLGAKVDGRIPIVVSSEVASSHHVGDEQQLGSTPIVIVGVVPSDAPFGSGDSWVLADSAFADQLANEAYEPTQLLISLRADASPAPVLATLKRLVPTAAVRDAASLAKATQAAPAAAGLRLALLFAAIGSAVLTALTVFVGSVTAAASRNRLIGMLRTMGLSARQSLGLVVWEIVPIVLAAAAVGLALGLALPRLVVATTDLGAFTGGLSRPPVTTEWMQLAWLLAALLAVVAVATVTAAALARRASPAGTVKMGAE